MRKLFTLLIIIGMLAGWAAPALAASFGISPAEVEFEVPADSSQDVEFIVYNFTGNVKISLENIPLHVEPTTIPVDAAAGGVKISLTFYGDESLGSKIYQGKIRFLASTGSMVATGIKVRATVTNLVEGETPVLVEPESNLPTSPEQQGTSSPSPESSNPEPESQGVTILPSPENSGSAGNPGPLLPPSPGEGNGELPIAVIIGIAAGVVLLIILIILLARRPRY